MKILELHAENVKRLRAVDIRPEGNVVVLGGDNGQGKTSVLDSIMMALGGSKAAPAVPVRRGADGALVELNLGDLRVRLRIEAGRRELVVMDADGNRRPSPQAILDKLYSRVTFDPLAFAADEPKKQLATLRALVGLDFTEDDKRRQKLYDERTAVGRQLANATERMTAIPAEVMSAPDQEVNVAALVKERDEANRIALRRMQREAAVEDARSRAERLRKELAEAAMDLQAAESDLSACQPVPDTKMLDLALCTAEDTNRNVRAKAERAKLAEECRVLEHKREALTMAIEGLDAEKVNRMAQAKWPVPGLGFDEDGVLMGGLPFDQASQAEKLRVSLAIGAALNPELRVLLMRDASLLDQRSMQLVREFAAEHDMQVWLERVGGADPGAIIIEDGQVATLDDKV